VERARTGQTNRGTVFVEVEGAQLLNFAASDDASHDIKGSSFRINLSPSHKRNKAGANCFCLVVVSLVCFHNTLLQTIRLQGWFGFAEHPVEEYHKSGNRNYGDAAYL
jgi:hypothetical protein